VFLLLSSLVVALFVSTITCPSAALAGDVSLGLLTATLPGTPGPVGAEATTLKHQDPATGYVWHVQRVGDDALPIYPTPDEVRDRVAGHRGLEGLTDVVLVDWGRGSGGLFGGRGAEGPQRWAFAGRGGSLYLIGVEASADEIERAEAVLLAVCKGARFSPGAGPSPREVVGMRFGGNVPVDWLPVIGGDTARVLTFSDASTGFAGTVLRADPSKHPYGTKDVGVLRRELDRAGWYVEATDPVVLKPFLARRFEATKKKTRFHDEPWILLIVRGRGGLWIVKVTVRDLGFARARGLLDLALDGARFTP
jgi:hypothetical protein